jgi:ketosteroid isomerase-like protein
MKRGPYRYAFGAVMLTLAVACSAEVAIDAKTSGVEAVAGAEANLEQALKADRDFAAMAKAEGLKPAFLKYMHPTDSRFLQPGGEARGAEAIAAGFDQSPPGFMVSWTPDGGHGSASGDLAVTTGLYTITIGDQTIEKGRYVTVWGKDADGALKATMDMSVPEPLTPVAPPVPDPEGRPG